MRSHLVTAAFVVVVVSFPSPALAAPGDLDPTFGDDGVVTTLFPGGAYATAVAVQPDGRIVAVGAAAGRTGTGEFATARYLPDGSLDPTFGKNGTVTTPIRGGHGDEARSVAIQPNGRIVVAGTDSWERFALVRYLPDGSLDPSFGGSGIVRTNFTSGDDVAWDVALPDDGRIVAVGGAGFGQLGFELARYRRNGALDPTFGDGGRVVTRYRGANARSVAIQPDGRIVVAGYNSWGLGVARYRVNGRLDASFATHGLLEPPDPSTPPIFALAVALQPNGRILAGGDYDIFRTGLARLRPDGTFDRSFGTDGWVAVGAGTGEQGWCGIVVLPHGRIVTLGNIGPHEGGTPADRQGVLARFTSDGNLDPAFGEDGLVHTSVSAEVSAEGLARQADGRLVVAGGLGENEGFILLRYLT